MPEQSRAKFFCGAAVVVGFLLIILLVSSFSYLQYYEFGLKQRKTTGKVDFSRVYANGRYLVGPDHKFITYQSDAHLIELEQLAVFSSGANNESIGLEFQIDVDLTYFLIEEEIGELHQELASNYRNVIISRTKDAIKNEAIFVSFTEYFQARKTVEERFRVAVQKRWDFAPSLHCTLDQFHLGRIDIPDSVATKQLQSQIQTELNDRETYLQQAQVEREVTAVDVNAIRLEKEKVLRTARAEASLVRSKAVAESERLKAAAVINGTQHLIVAADIQTQEHKTAFSYIRALKNRNSVDIDVSYINPDSVVRTAAVN